LEIINSKERENILWWNKLQKNKNSETNIKDKLDRTIRG
jgi:hypothetical protein